MVKSKLGGGYVKVDRIDCAMYIGCWRFEHEVHLMLKIVQNPTLHPMIYIMY